MDIRLALIVPAAGSGTRMNLDKNKILLEIDGKPVIRRTLEAFSGARGLEEVIIVCKPEERVLISDAIGEASEDKLLCKLRIKFADGGSTRQESITNGLKLVDSNMTHVIVHDGARPFIKKKHIGSAIEEAIKHRASAVGVRVKDTIKSVDPQFMIVGTVDRSALWQIQTPQIFEKGLLLKAYEKAALEGFVGTDDCSLVENMGVKIKIVEGDYHNIKITTIEDVDYGRFILGAWEE